MNYNYRTFCNPLFTGKIKFNIFFAVIIKLSTFMIILPKPCKIWLLSIKHESASARDNCLVSLARNQLVNISITYKFGSKFL
jgi:hypothetical protein